MCGIFGFVDSKNTLSKYESEKVINSLFILSQSRGKDASGFALSCKNKIVIFKLAKSASVLIRQKQYKNELNKAFRRNNSCKEAITFLGHARMVTNGAMANNNNNQPVIKDGLVGIHNGIITNDKQLWQKYPSLRRQYDVDTEIFLSLLRMFLKKGFSLEASVAQAYSEIEGAASMAVIFVDRNQLLLSTNTGSLYLAQGTKYPLIIFASERYFLEHIITSYSFLQDRHLRITQLKPGTGCIVNVVTNLNIKLFALSGGKKNKKANKKQKLLANRKIENIIQQDVKQFFNFQSCSSVRQSKKAKQLLWRAYEKARKKIEKLRRCTKCILPETMPFIKFDRNGVCNYCKNYQKTQVKGRKALEEKIESFRKRDGRQDCIVTFSGGRDSSFGLHYIKTQLNLNPVAYSYDWGMLTDLGRRNQSRMTAALGIEHILISADIQKKRRYIRKNVEAWLKKPDLGLVPLFMAGDKQYFYHANQLQKQMQIDLVILCENPLERTDFKSGFCGIRPKRIKDKKFYMLSLSSKLQLLFYYARSYIANPAYFNQSIFDTMHAFFSYYFIPHNYLSLYDYVQWDERKVNSVLERYNWEKAKDTRTTWRIGDGTVALYNYIYYIGSGFTESDTFRSNQIREGMLKREHALEIVHEENRPRFKSIFWYCQTVGLDMYKTIKIIAEMQTPYLYTK